MNVFRFSAKNVFLTYPQTDTSFDDFEAALCAVLGSHGEFSCRVARELHEDGEPHYHAVVLYNRKLNLRNARAFDVLGRHPNIQPVRSIRDSLKYVSKDGDFRDHGELPDGGATWGELVALETREDFMSAIRDSRPRDYILSFERLEYYAAARYKPVVPAYEAFPGDTFKTTPTMERWIGQRLEQGTTSMGTNRRAFPFTLWAQIALAI